MEVANASAVWNDSLSLFHVNDGFCYRMSVAHRRPDASQRVLFGWRYSLLRPWSEDASAEWGRETAGGKITETKNPSRGSGRGLCVKFSRRKESTENLEKLAEGEAILETCFAEWNRRRLRESGGATSYSPCYFLSAKLFSVFPIFCLISTFLLFGRKISLHNCKKT